MKKMLFSDSITRAISTLRNEHVIAYPTEALFGIGCDPDSRIAVLRLLALKKRPIQKGLILIASRYEQLIPYINDSVLTKGKRKEILSVWPGHITLLLPARESTPSWLTGRFNSLAVRVTDYPPVVQLCEAFNKPLISTSANLSGLQPCRTLDEVYNQFGNAFPVLIGKTGGYKKPSQIRDVFTGKRFR